MVIVAGPPTVTSPPAIIIVWSLLGHTHTDRHIRHRRPTTLVACSSSDAPDQPERARARDNLIVNAHRRRQIGRERCPVGCPVSRVSQPGVSFLHPQSHRTLNCCLITWAVRGRGHDDCESLHTLYPAVHRVATSDCFLAAQRCETRHLLSK